MKYKTIAKTPPAFDFLFSICTIVTNLQEYEEMKKSFEDCGFTSECEYLVADNTEGNQFDAYEAIKRFIKEARGKYIIIVHQDVRCIDAVRVLISCLDTLDSRDPKWAICGNAGSHGYHRTVRHLHNAGKKIEGSNLPARVVSLDENFLVLKSSASLAVSADLEGFHLYGTDLCLVADFLGYNCYVIPFMVNHLSLGNLVDLEKYKDKFIERYGHKLRSRFIETTCTKFYLADSASGSRFTNSPLVFFFIKAFQRLKQLGK